MAPLIKQKIRFIGILRAQHNDCSCQSIVKKRLKMRIDTRTKSRAYGLWKALRFCAFFCLDLASLATLCRGLILLVPMSVFSPAAQDLRLSLSERLHLWSRHSCPIFPVIPLVLHQYCKLLAEWFIESCPETRERQPYSQYPGA